MKKTVLILLAGISVEIVAMEGTGPMAGATSNKATDSSALQGLFGPSAFSFGPPAKESLDPEVLANLQEHCTEGPLTLEMADSVLTLNKELNKKRLGEFVTRNFSMLNWGALHPNWNYTTFEDIEDAYVGLLFIYQTDTTPSDSRNPSETRKALESFVRQNEGTINDFLSKGRTSSDPAGIKQALSCLDMLGVICSNREETEENLTAQRALESKLQALESGRSSINNNNNVPSGNEPADKSGGSKPNRNSGSSFITLPRVLLTTGFLALAGYFVYTRNSEDKRK